MKQVTWCIAIALMVGTAANADSLFSRQVADRGTLVAANKMRFSVGDVITVLVRENIDASGDSDLNTRKRTQIDMQADPAANPSITGSDALVNLPKGVLPNIDIEGDNRHQTSGSTIRKNQVKLTISCTVTKVWPNGNVEISGDKRVTVNRDDSLIKLSGVARTTDVSADNTIDSNQLANAVVELKGKGPMWNNQRRGLLTRLLDWIAPY